MEDLGQVRAALFLQGILAFWVAPHAEPEAGWVILNVDPQDVGLGFELGICDAERESGVIPDVSKSKKINKSNIKTLGHAGTLRVLYVVVLSHYYNH